MRVVRVELRHPFFHRGNDFSRAVHAQFDFRAGARVVFRFPEPVEEILDGLAVDAGRLEQRPALVSDPVNAPVRVVAVRVANVVLHMSDELVGPVQEVDRACWRDVPPDRAEVRVVRFDEVLERLAFEAGALLAYSDAEDALEPNDIAVQKIALKIVGEMPAGNQAGAGAGPRGPLPKLVQLRVLRRVIEMAAEGRTEIAVVSGRIGNDVVAPIIENAAVRIGEAVGDITLELVRARLEPVNARVDVAHRTVGGFDQGA